MKHWIYSLALLLALPTISWAKLPLDKIKLPPGFRIEVYANSVPNARSMTLSPGGTLYVGTRTEGKVYALRDNNRDGKIETVKVIASSLTMPNGVVFHKGSLFVAEISRILRFDDIENKLDQPPKPHVVTNQFPRDQHHGWKFIAIGPDEKLYVPVGAPCNVCEKDNPIYSTIQKMNLDGSNIQPVALGVRNSVGFDWHPTIKQLWFTDNGRDMMGDDQPADELNRVIKEGDHFGFPYCHAGNLRDPEFGAKANCDEYQKPVMNLGPHVAALGMRFYTGTMFPKEYRQQILIAEHGSWNRSNPLGYRIMLVRLAPTPKYEVFAEGWLQGESAWGRPVDVLVMPDGALLVSDDKAGVIYRISYQKN